MTHPIPDAALDDRLGVVGMTGSGKTYGAGTLVERLLGKHGRVVIPDPLGVWWGLRQLADGKAPSGLEVVIFGGPHADLPLTTSSGALIGETVATMRESAIIDLSLFETAASERRFMLAFLDALYRKATGEPVHLIFDEADLWAPERILDKEGEATKLHGMLQTVVRRGRVKGLTSWLITQRPAALSKSVLSQVDGLVGFRLTASQDRKSLGAWIEGQADRDDGKALLARLPEKGQGDAVVWLPARGILNDVHFPHKRTYDSSRSPKRGEKRQSVDLKPLDLGALKARLSTIEEETKASDPRALKAEISRLKKQMTDAAALAAKQGAVTDPLALEAAEQRGHKRGRIDGREEGRALGRREGYQEATEAGVAALRGLEPPDAPLAPLPTPRVAPPVRRPIEQRPVEPKAVAHTNGSLSRPQLKIIEALAFWAALGFDRPTRTQVGVVAGYSPTSGGFANLLSTLNTAGQIEYPNAGLVALTPEGRAHAPPPDPRSVRDRAMSILSGPQQRVLSAVMEQADPLSKEEVAGRTDYSATSGGFANLLSSLRSLGLIEYPGKSQVQAAEWLFS